MISPGSNVRARWTNDRRAIASSIGIAERQGLSKPANSVSPSIDPEMKSARIWRSSSGSADVQGDGIPDAKYGEELNVWIIPRTGAALTEDEVRAHCRDRIAHYKIPRHILFIDAFPMTVTGKVQKFAMREQMLRILEDGRKRAG